MPKYKFADLVVEYSTRYSKLTEYSLPYLTDCDSAADIIIELDDEKLSMLQEKYPEMTAEECEYFFTGQAFYSRLLAKDGCMIHSSAVMMDNAAYLFTAPCGTGKSTHTALWQKAFGSDRAKILNDDKPAVRKLDGIYYAYGTPFSGKNKLSVNAKIPLKAICILERGEENHIRRIDPREAILFFLTQTIRPKDAERMDMLLKFIDGLLETIPVYKMQCNISTDAAITAYEAMKD